MIINLRVYYPHLQYDCFEDIPEEIVALLVRNKLNDESYDRKMRYRKPLSLDYGNERSKDEMLIIFDNSPEAIYEKKISIEQLNNLLSKLPPKHQRRIHVHFLLGLSKAEIARIEGVSRQAICYSISYGLAQLRKMLNIC